MGRQLNGVLPEPVFVVSSYLGSLELVGQARVHCFKERENKSGQTLIPAITLQPCSLCWGLMPVDKMAFCVSPTKLK